ncbi:TPA: hypothetical protein ACH7R7_002541 [Escherichia coli]
MKVMMCMVLLLCKKNRGNTRKPGEAPGLGLSNAIRHKTAYNFVNVGNGAASHAPQQAIYAAISKQLPAWAYLYLAPKSVELDNGEKVAFPYLLDQGKAELFVYPEA